MFRQGKHFRMPEPREGIQGRPFQERGDRRTSHGWVVAFNEEGQLHCLSIKRQFRENQNIISMNCKHPVYLPVLMSSFSFIAMSYLPRYAIVSVALPSLLVAHHFDRLNRRIRRAFSSSCGFVCRERKLSFMIVIFRFFSFSFKASIVKWRLIKISAGWIFYRRGIRREAASVFWDCDFGLKLRKHSRLLLFSGVVRCEVTRFKKLCLHLNKFASYPPEQYTDWAAKSSLLEIFFLIFPQECHW